MSEEQEDIVVLPADEFQPSDIMLSDLESMLCVPNIRGIVVKRSTNDPYTGRWLGFYSFADEELSDDNA